MKQEKLSRIDKLILKEQEASALFDRTLKSLTYQHLSVDKHIKSNQINSFCNSFNLYLAVDYHKLSPEYQLQFINDTNNLIDSLFELSYNFPEYKKIYHDFKNMLTYIPWSILIENDAFSKDNHIIKVFERDKLDYNLLFDLIKNDIQQHLYYVKYNLSDESVLNSKNKVFENIDILFEFAVDKLRKSDFVDGIDTSEELVTFFLNTLSYEIFSNHNLNFDYANEVKKIIFSKIPLSYNQKFSEFEVIEKPIEDNNIDTCISIKVPTSFFLEKHFLPCHKEFYNRVNKSFVSKKGKKINSGNLLTSHIYFLQRYSDFEDIKDFKVFTSEYTHKSPFESYDIEIVVPKERKELLTTLIIDSIFYPYSESDQKYIKNIDFSYHDILYREYELKKLLDNKKFTNIKKVKI